MATRLHFNQQLIKRSACLLLSATALASSFTISGAYMNQPMRAEAASKKKSKVQVSDNDGLDSAVRPYVNQGLWSEAIERLEKLSASDDKPGRNEAWLAFGYLYTGKGELLKALGKRVQSMSVNEQDPNAKIIVEIFDVTVQGKFDEAEKLFANIKDENSDALALFARACVALKKGNSKLAADYCERIVGLCPNFAWGYRTLGFIQDKSLKNAELAKRAYERALTAEPNFKDVRSLLIDLLLARNDFDGAIAIANQAIEEFPRDSSNYYRLAQIYQQQWRLLEALAELQKAVDLAKDDARFYRAMAGIYRLQDKIDDAIVEQQKAVELSKDKAFELTELSSLQEQNGKIAEAIESLKLAIKDSPANLNAQQKLVVLLKRDHRTDELIAEYKREIELEPKSEQLRLAIADSYKQSGKLNEAVEQLKEAANLEQSDPRPHREIAKIELIQKNYQAAAKSYTRALNISLASHAADAGSVDDLVALGFCYASNNDYTQAETAFTTAFAMLQLGSSTGLVSPVNPSDILRSLSVVFFTEGRYREAVINLETGVIPYDKEVNQKNVDLLMCAESKALRDCTADSVKELQATFAILDHASQLKHLPAYVDTLVKLKRKEQLVESVAKFSDAELSEQCPLVLANSLLLQDKTKEATSLITKILADKNLDIENQSTAYGLMAQIQLKDNDKKAAKESLTKAHDVNAKDFNAWVEQGRIELSDKQSADAQHSAQRALDINQYCVPAYIVLGESFMQTNKLKDADANFAKAVDLYPNSIDAHKGLQSAYQKELKTSDAQREQEIISNLTKAL